MEVGIVSNSKAVVKKLNIKKWFSAKRLAQSYLSCKFAVTRLLAMGKLKIDCASLLHSIQNILCVYIQ